MLQLFILSATEQARVSGSGSELCGESQVQDPSYPLTFYQYHLDFTVRVCSLILSISFLHRSIALWRQENLENKLATLKKTISQLFILK